VPGPAREPSLAIDASARRLRRSLSLTAWAALEELLLDAELQAPGRPSAPASARALAARLAVGKDTAAGALRRLAAAGLVGREDHRDGARGVFARSVYVIDAARLGEDGIRRQTAQPTRSRHRGAVAIAAGHGNSQATLFDLPAPDEQ
jgi:Bacterial regulatory proteins, gntR family